MALFIGTQYESPDYFGFMKNPNLLPFDYNEFEQAVHMKQSDKEFKSLYWNARNKMWAQALIGKNGESGLLNTDFVGSYLYEPNDLPEYNLFKNKSAWETLHDITNSSHGGYITAFDTETIGSFDINNLENSSAKVAGITEISFTTKHVSKNNIGKEIYGEQGSFVFGIDQNQKAWLEDVLDRKIRGEVLDSTEQSAMERMSRYSTIEHEGHSFKFQKKEWQGKNFIISDSLNLSNENSIDDIRSGINTLSSLYTQDREEQISMVVQKINSIGNGEFDHLNNRAKSTIIGQNLEYDINVINTYAQMHGTAKLDNELQYADTMFAMRAYAKANNITVGDLVKQYNGSISAERLGSLEAFMEAISDSKDYAKFAAHNAYQDSLATIDVMLNNGLDIINRGYNVTQKISSQPNPISLAENIVKINKQGNIRSEDFLVIDNQITTGYSTANQYWKFSGAANMTFDALTITDPRNKDIEHEIRGTRNRYVAKFNLADNENVSLYKSFKSEEHFQNWLYYNTDIINPNNANIELQTQLHDKDVARRVIDGFFEVNQVGQSWNSIEKANTAMGGFASFKQYYDMYTDISNMSNDAVKKMKLLNSNGKSITTSKQLLKNINVGNNIDAIIEYGDKNNIKSIQSFFRNAQYKNGMTAHQAGISSYDERIKMQEIFSMFSNNKDFFEYANETITSATDNNLKQTILFKMMQEDYLGSKNVSFDKEVKYTIDDLNSVSIKTGKNTWSNIDVTNVNRGGNKLERLFKSEAKKATKNGENINAATSNMLFDTVDNLVDRSLLSIEDKRELTKLYSGSNDTNNLAKSIVQRLNNRTEQIRKDGLEKFVTNLESIREFGIESFDENDRLYMTKVANKNHRTISESSTSVMSAVKGTINKEFKDITSSKIHILDNATLISGMLDDYSGNKKYVNQVGEQLKKMHYSDKGVEDLLRVFHSSNPHNAKANLKTINDKLSKEGKDQVLFAFYKPNKQDSSAFAIFTTQKHYAGLAENLANLGDEVTDERKIKEAIQGLGAYFEIPYLEIHDIGINSEGDKSIEALSKLATNNRQGHQARSVLVRQSDSSYKYDVLGLNLYKQGDKYHGSIRDQGDSFLTSIRPHFEQAINSVSEGNYDSATRQLNSINKAKLSSDASPQMITVPDNNGKLRKMHVATQKDIDYAFMLSLGSEDILTDRDLSLKGLLRDFSTDAIASKAISAQNNKTASQALTELYDIFNDEYKIVAPVKNGKHAPRNIRNVGKVFDSEQFEIFFKENVTNQAGGIQSERIVQRYLSNHPESALSNFKNMGLLEILNQAIQESPYAADDLKETIDLLTKSNLNAVGSEAMSKNNRVYVNYNMAENNNSRLSGQYRPTYAQRSNYKPYTLEDGVYFKDYKTLEENLGIHFGDVYTSESFVKRMDKLDKDYNRYTSQSVTRRNIVGAVASLSDTEIQLNRATSEAQLKQLAKSNGLDENALKKVYERMISGINTYEGKAYLRPSLANQKFFMLGDTKNMKSNELRALWETGTEEEKRVTSTVLDELVKKGTVKNGDVIGYRLNNKNNMSPIFYNGPTVDNFDRKNVDDLLEKGKTEVEVTRQIEDGKLFIGEEKGTYESFAYFNSLDEKKQLEEIKETMKNVGLTPTDNLDENIKTLNKYTDIAMDVIAPIEGSSHKTIALINTNINKHITDMPFDTKWNLIQYEFAQNGEQGFRNLRTIANEIVISKDNNTIETFGQHLRYNERHNTITFDNPNSKGSINVLDELIEKLRKSDLDEAKNAVRELDAFSKGNFAFQSIQRQQMNTFQGKAFKLDSRVYQALAMQGEGNYTKGNGAELAELIRQNILSGEYDNRISGVGRSKIDDVWSSIVHSRRGYLQPKNEHEMLLGIMDALSFKEGKLDISQKNILNININDVLANIPSSGANYEGYKNFIFKTDGEFSHFIKSYANKGGNNAILEASSNSFYLDFGRTIKYGDKNIEGILMPFQHINTTQDQIFLGESTKSTIGFLNAYKKALEQSKPGEEINITEALDDLFKAYAKETDPYDKKSLASKVAFRMNMPNSSGALALDTIVPTLNPEVSGIISNDDIMRIAKLEASIGDIINLYGIGNDNIQKDINELNKLYGLRKEAIKNQAALIKDESVKLNEKILNLTGDKKYLKYILGTKNDKEVIESAIVVGKQMFYNTEMDTGHIGHQLMTDYFIGRKGITKYDSFSKLEGKDFEISNDEFKKIFGFIETVDADNKVVPGNVAKKFKGTQHELWANETQQALDDIMFGNLAKYKNLSEDARQAYVISKFNERVDKYIKNIQARVGFDGDKEIVKSVDHALSQAEQKKFLLQINELFESVGDRYAKEVGILGMTNRYPNFSETGLLPVRIFLDDTIKGSSVRFLGPQFSILQNLDFDGDNEFLKFLGNGGLLAKNAVESEMMQKQFDFMNQFNREAYAQSIEDSIKNYRIGDETAFKATLLENIDKQKYNAAKEQFLKEMTEEDLKWFNGLNEDLQKYIYDHNKYITKEFVNFDKTFGTSFDNPQMVKAALQAKAAKEYIGNFSKPNLYVRNTLTYMLSDVEEGSQAEAELLRIKNLLFSFNNPEIKDGIRLSEKDIQSFGLLTLLEQQGIDTKHVHDADILNNSTAWREGINNLFRNAKNAPEINLEVKNSSIEQLVEGARKVFFGDIATADTNIPVVVSQISKDILNTSLDDLLTQASGQTSKELKANGLLGKIYIRGLYDLSNMDNAYEGFNGSLRKAGVNPNLPKFLEALTNEDYDTLVKKSNYDIESIFIRTMHDSFSDKRFATDDALQVFGRKLHDNDILLYQSANGPVAYKFRGTESFDGQIMAKLSPYDLKKGKVGDEIITTQGITIKDLNEELKRNPRGTKSNDRNYLLNFARKDGNTDKNISSIYIDNLSNEERHLLIERHAAEISVADKLNRLFEERNDNPNFSRLFKTTTKDGMIIDNYDGYNNIGINKIIGNIVGTDPNDFKKKANTIEQYLQYGIDKQYISGSEDAKDLIRKINKNIAENPRSSINRFQGDTPFELITNYLGDDVSIDGDKKWLRLGIENVTLSNEIDEAVKRRIEQQHLNLDLYAKNFYESVGDEKAFKTALESYNKEVSSTMNDIFSQFNRSNDAKQEFINYFGWEHFNKNKDFNIQSLNVKITGEKSLENLNAKVGYGRYIGTKLSDLNYNQVQEILDNELTNEIISNLADNSIEKYAAENTATILKGYNAARNSVPYLSFENADVLRTNYRALHEESEAAKEAALKSLKESAEENAEVLKKKTLLGDGIKESIKSMSPETKKYLKIGGAITAGALALGVAGHALFDNNNNNNVEVPKSVTEQIGNGEIPDARPITQGKSASEYPNENSDAKQTRMQKRKIAPPSLHKNRTIYHDAGSGFNFKVSAQSYNKLQDEAYHRMAQQAGIQNNSLYVSRDNSKITDNWLENKFAQLME